MARRFAQGDIIEASLALAAARGGDLTRQVYARLFAAHPETEALFGKDVRDAVKGEMLAQVFDTIFDYIGPRVYADHLMRSHADVHDGYGVPPALFLAFFGIVAATLADVIGPEWSGETASAWDALLGEIATTMAPASLTN
jgi:hemoglobin-like flavoprotein